MPYRLVVPPGWIRLPVDPAAMRVAARAMLLRRFAPHPRDTTAALRREIEQQLLSIVGGPGHGYMRMLLTLDLQVERRPITATCLVSLLPQGVQGEQGLQALAASQSEGAVESVVEDLGPNRGVVVVRDVRTVAQATPDRATARLARGYTDWLVTGSEQEPACGPIEPPDDELPAEVLDAARTTRSVDVFLPVPDCPRVLLLSFSTPVAPLFPPLTTLFLTIASTVQWQRDEQVWS